MVNLLGGKWEPDDSGAMDAAMALLREHAGDMEFCIIQTIESGLEFTRTTAALNKLENERILRLHLFGKGGDFTLRYDDGKYLWRFVGAALSQAELGGTPYPTTLSEGSEQHALLWGEYDTNRQRWHENIVGSARLTYPAEAEHERLTIHARSVVDDKSGEVVAFWTYKLSAYVLPQEGEEQQ